MTELTQTVQKGGCAAKIAAVELRKILSRVQFPPNDKSVLVDGGLFDDAGIYQISEDLALVQTLDFFTPILDTPRKFGAVATANALSDVYAMGGEPKTAMAILAFPLATMPDEVAVEVLQGASDLMSQANVNFIGGHSIDDETLKFGLSVTGYVNPKFIWSNSKAQSGDVLILTKPLGTGTATAALKRRELSEQQIEPVIHSMCALNRTQDLLSLEQRTSIRAATDITGFGLAGHALNMAKASQKTFCFQFSTLPVFDVAFDCLEKGFLTKAHRTNAEYVAGQVDFAPISDTKLKIVFDPQTSGGLLLSVRADQAPSVLASLQKRFLAASIVGSVVDFGGKFLELQA